MNPSDKTRGKAVDGGPAAQPGLLSPAAFADRVMSAISVMPQPTPTRAFLSAIRSGAWREVGATLSVAWHLGTVRSWSVAPRVRARSFALVLAVASVLATGSLVAAAAIQQVAPQRGEHLPAAVPSAPTLDERVVEDVDAVDVPGPSEDAVDGQGAEPGSGTSDDGGDVPDGDAASDERDDGAADEPDANDDGPPDRDAADEPDDEDDSGDDTKDDRDERDGGESSDTSDDDDAPRAGEEADGADPADEPSNDSDDGGSDG